MLKKPRLKHYFQAKIVDAEGVFLTSERNSVLLNDPLYQLLVPMLDGQSTIDEIIDAILPKLLPGEISSQDFISTSANIYYALMQMEQKGYIVENDDDCLPSELIILCDTLGIAPKEAGQQLRTTKVTVKNYSSIATSEFVSILESLHIQVSDDGDIAVILTDDYLLEDLELFNKEFLQSQRPWMLVKPVGTIVWIGPIFCPGKTGCWKCLAQRLQVNRPVEAFIGKRKSVSTPSVISISALPSIAQAVLGIAATEVVKWIFQRGNKQLEGNIFTLDTISLQTRNHILVKRPQCPCCGTIELNQEPAPIVLGNRKKTFTTDGGHRCLEPEETLKRYQQHISPLTGVIRELKPLSQKSNGLIHTYAATHHFASMSDDLDTLCRNVGGGSAGKGRTDVQAKASAFCEAVERYSGIFQGDEIRYKSSYQEMIYRAIHPNTCMNFSQEQYENRQEWNSNCSSFFQKVPEPFDEERIIDWTPVWSLTHEDFKYLPSAYCYYGYPKLFMPDCWAESNGCAAGNTLEEAILQGFMELVERDSISLWWYNRIRRPSVDLDSFDDPYFKFLGDYYRTLHRDIWVLDITSDFNIPAFVAISRRVDQEIEDIIFGFGAHFDAKLAILRALTETNQSLNAVLSVNADGRTRYPSSADRIALNWWGTVTLGGQHYLIPDEDSVPKVCADYPKTWSDNLLEDVTACKEIAKKHGMEMLVLDQTRPDIGLKVVKVIVPGIRHFWKRLAPGRLYDIPVQLGWLKKSLKEKELNPFPMWM